MGLPLQGTRPRTAFPSGIQYHWKTLTIRAQVFIYGEGQPPSCSPIAFELSALLRISLFYEASSPSLASQKIKMSNDKESANEPRIRWNAVDEEAADRGRDALAQRRSNRSRNSIHSSHSRRGSIDPSTAFPIQYRSM